MTQLHIHQIPAFSDNYIYILVCSETGETAVVDPGEAAPVLKFLQKHDLKLQKILCTHDHADHISGNLELKSKTQCRIIGAEYDKNHIPKIDETLVEGDKVTVGINEASVLQTEGHTAGHISYYFHQTKDLFCGDTLFSAGCGRLFGGTALQMYNSLQKIAALPEDTTIYCAHEYTASNIRFALSVDCDNQDLQDYQKHVTQLRASSKPTIPTPLSLEKKVNPFLRCHDLTIRRQLGMSDASDEEIFATLRSKKDRF